MKVTAIILGVVIVALFGVLIFVRPVQGPTVSAPAPTALVSPDGHLAVALPRANDSVSSPVAIEGTVIGGGWFFEGSFPIKVLDGDGRVIGKGTAQALSDWTSTGTVPFAASVAFTAPGFATGTILFLKDNPSGAPENTISQNAGSFSVPVKFK